MTKPPKTTKSFDAFVKKIGEYKPDTLPKAPPHKPKKELLEQVYKYNRKTGEIDIVPGK